jgi:anti-anti-sigma factor
MEIQRAKTDGTLVLALAGRLDATWAEAVEAALAAAVREGEHRIALDLADVDYISSAGLRVLIAAYKQLAAIQGGFSVRNPQSGVAKVIELSGLGMLLATTAAPAQVPHAVSTFETESASWEGFGVPAAVTVRALGNGSAFDVSGGERVEFSARRFGLGIAALAETRAEAAPRFGEFLAVAGCAAHLPPGGSMRPDFLIAEQALTPAAWLAGGLVVEGEPSMLLRFESGAKSRGIPFVEIARAALENSGASAAAFVLIAETAGLVGASLRRSPDGASSGALDFPAVRDWLNFTSERAFRDTTSLVTGVIARPGSPLDVHLRPFAEGLLAHAHAAVFPYRPIRKGEIPLEETVRGLFESGGMQAVLHLLNDTREPDGAGDSEFTRGACWVAPIA